jgi:hypothetical protein
MIDVQLRVELESFLGEEQYRKFVRIMNTVCKNRGRLLFWQEVAWKEFVVAHPRCDMSFKEIQLRLRVCWIHSCELVAETKPVFGRGVYLNYTREYTEAWTTLFPNSSEDVPERVTMGGYHLPVELAEVWECPECCKARAEWGSQVTSTRKNSL